MQDTLYDYNVIYLFSAYLKFYHTYLSFFYFKKAAEGSFDQPTCKLWACRATTAPPRYPYYISSLLTLSYSLSYPFSFIYKKLHRRESNPGHKRERLVCYQLHHNGFLCYFSLRPLELTLSVYVYETLFPCWLFLYGAILFLSFFERFHGVVGYHITFT